MTRYVTPLILAAALLLAGSSSANDTLAQHWPRYTTGPVQVTVVPSTTPGYALDPGYNQWLNLAISNWNQSSKVHLTLAAPAPCGSPLQTIGRYICVMGQYLPIADGGGFANTWTENDGRWWLIKAAQVTVNTYGIPPGVDDFVQAMIFCHELGEALGLPDPSDDPVTPTVEPTCLTRDWSRIQSFPSAWNYQQLDTLYAAVDPAPPPPCVKRNGKCR